MIQLPETLYQQVQLILQQPHPQPLHLHLLHHLLQIQTQHLIPCHQRTLILYPLLLQVILHPLQSLPPQLQLVKPLPKVLFSFLLNNSNNTYIFMLFIYIVYNLKKIFICFNSLFQNVSKTFM